jgi:two-component system, NtrC family, sensor kinase
MRAKTESGSAKFAVCIAVGRQLVVTIVAKPNRMTLRRKILFKDVLLLLCLALMIGTAFWGLLRQRQHVQASLNEYAALQKVEIGQNHLLAFSQAVHSGTMASSAAISDLQAASLSMREYKAIISQYNSILPAEITSDMQLDVHGRTNRIVTALVRLQSSLDPARHHDSQKPPDAIAVSTALDDVARDMTGLLSVCNDFVHRTQLVSDHDLRTAIEALAGIAGLTFVSAVLASFWQYHRMMVPLHRLRRWCGRITRGDFSSRYTPTDDSEFLDLARDVNAMADELEAFSRKMESMVSDKSRELVRSERLASVGYLAAGVAHEINNPLNIISGYAELTTKRLRRLANLQAGSPIDQETIEHLSIIRSEAFRCKEITGKLLSLAKGNGDTREIISLSDAVLEVVALVRGLKAMRSKQLTVTIPSDEPLPVLANLTEIKQVLLNLTVNAIEAVDDQTGKISIEGKHVGDWIEITVTDNGRGMSSQTLERVFEPFFTNKRGAGEPGTGLGLSITHAIVTNHGGGIRAQSDGPNHGSRFSIRLPASTARKPSPRATEPAPMVTA